MIPERCRPGRPVAVAAATVTALASGGVGAALAATPSAPSAPSRAATTTSLVTPLPAPARCLAKLPGRGLPGPGRGFALPGHNFGLPGRGLPLPARGPGFPWPPGPLGLGAFAALHGQFVTSKAGGGYQTIDIQRGTVTAASSGSITVKSSDGYTSAYQVTSATDVNGQRAGTNSIKTGQMVSVLATVTGTSATATQIVDFAARFRLPGCPRLPDAP
jgi:hypothetical protein